MLCQPCQQIFLPGGCTELERGGMITPIFEHHPSGQSLRQAALDGCDLCLRMWDLLTAREQDDLCTIDELEEKKPYFGKPGATICQIQQFVTRGSFDLKFERLSTGPKARGVRWHVTTARHQEPTRGFESHEITDSTSSDETVSLAAKWIKNCVDHHACGSLARSKDTEQWHPTRLVDMGRPEDKLRSLRLVEAEDMPSDCLYMTLSHCWGKLEIFKLTTKNIDDLKVSIPTDKLTETFRNAIEVTRKLRTRYLWIDSLCIMQDSGEDWAREASLMGKVYKHSYCNIAATGFSDGLTGFFCSRDPALVKPLTLKFPVEVQNEKLTRKILSRWEKLKQPQAPEPCEYHDFVDVNLWKHRVDDAPLNSRGWVVQERVLSPRIIHFTTHQLFWECHELEACETFPSGLPNVLSESRYSKDLSPFNPLTKPAPALVAPLYYTLDEPNSRNAFHIWDAIVKTYSSGKLSHEKDKLVAISGMAREMQPLMRGRYLAGLWEVKLVRQLLWVTGRANANTLITSRSNEYRAPSWSWASVDEPLKTFIHWDWRGAKNQRDVLIDILDAQTVPFDLTSGDAMGQISNGYLQIRGRMIEVSLVRRPTEDPRESRRYNLCLSSQSIDEVTVFEDDQEQDQTGLKSIFCVPITVSISLPEVSLDRRTLVYGLLVSSTDNESGDFRRVGVFMAPNGERFLTSLGQDLETFDWRNETQFHGSGGKEFGDQIFTLV